MQTDKDKMSAGHQSAGFAPMESGTSRHGAPIPAEGQAHFTWNNNLIKPGFEFDADFNGHFVHFIVTEINFYTVTLYDASARYGDFILRENIHGWLDQHFIGVHTFAMADMNFARWSDRYASERDIAHAQALDYVARVDKAIADGTIYNLVLTERAEGVDEGWTMCQDSS